MYELNKLPRPVICWRHFDDVTEDMEGQRVLVWAGGDFYKSGSYVGRTLEKVPIYLGDDGWQICGPVAWGDFSIAGSFETASLIRWRSPADAKRLDGRRILLATGGDSFKTGHFVGINDQAQPVFIGEDRLVHWGVLAWAYFPAPPFESYGAEGSLDRSLVPV